MSKILIIGSGGREHALAWKIKQSPKVERIYVAPGNGGTSKIAQNISIDSKDINGLLLFARTKEIDLTVVGPEDSLAAGVVDAFKEEGLRIFGPTKYAAQIETSKAFAKQFMVEENIPTAKFERFDNYENALSHAENQPMPVVIKASGLASGKGVFICNTVKETERVLRELFVEYKLGIAGTIVIIEEFLEGPELSVHVFSDGKNAVLMPIAQDHKTIFDNDRGPNTGGMGAYAPVPWVDTNLLLKIKKNIVAPALIGFQKRDNPFVGCLYPGLKITPQGPKVLEFNARFGDPETQPLMRLLETDLVEIIVSCINGTLDKTKVSWSNQYAICVVLASEGYPDKPKIDVPIYNLDKVQSLHDVIVFHAGTKHKNKDYFTSGGRAINITATGKTLQSAKDLAYQGVRTINFEGMQYRTDIGAKALTSPL